MPGRVYNQNVYGRGGGAQVADGEGVTVKMLEVEWWGVIEEPFQKHLKIGVGKGKSCL